MLASQKQQIVALFQAALGPLLAGSELQPNVTLERPRDPSHGDIACNIAMQLVGIGAMPSIDDARSLIERSFPVEVFEPAPSAVWDRAYANFKTLSRGSE